jgi:hypothetical protein
MERGTPAGLARIASCMTRAGVQKRHTGGTGKSSSPSERCAVRGIHCPHPHRQIGLGPFWRDPLDFGALSGLVRLSGDGPLGFLSTTLLLHSTPSA